MDSEPNPIEVLSAESQRLEAFADFWRRRIDIEKAYLENLSGLQIPDPPGNGQLQELVHKTRELLLDELEERRRGFAKLNEAYKALTDKFWTEEGPNHFDIWGSVMKPSILRIDTLAAEITAAESVAESLAVEAWDSENSTLSSSARKGNQPRSTVLSRFLDKAKNDQPEMHYHTSSFLSADSTYRQKIQKINEAKNMVSNEIVPQTVHYIEHNRRCVIALKHIVSTFSAVHSDLAQVLNVTSSQLCIASSSVDASMESASFSERLGESFTPLIQLYRYKSYETSSSLRPTTMLFGCPLPDDLASASIGERAVAKAFEVILVTAAKRHPWSLYQAMCDAHKHQGNDIKLSALQLESLWDQSRLDGGPGAVDYLTKARSDGLLVHFLTRLPEPFLPLHDSDIKRLTKLDSGRPFSVAGVFGKAGNRMGTARRCNLARLFLTLRRHQQNLRSLVISQPEGVQILTRATEFLPHSHLADHFSTAIQHIYMNIDTPFKDSLILPDDSIEEWKHAGLLW